MSPRATGGISKRGNAQARSVLVEAVLGRGPPARAAARLRRAYPRAQGSTGRGGRCRPQARLPRLAAAHQGRGLRFRAAVPRARQAAPRGARRRGATAPHAPRQAAGLRKRHRTASRARAHRTRRGGLPPPDRRLEGNQTSEQGRRRDTWARTFNTVKTASNAAGHQPRTCASARRHRRPPQTVARSHATRQEDLTFIRTQILGHSRFTVDAANGSPAGRPTHPRAAPPTVSAPHADTAHSGQAECAVSGDF